MYKNILIPTLMDSEEGLKTAVDAAKRMLAEDGKITLLNVIEDLPVYVESYVATDVLAGNVEDVLSDLNEVATTLGTEVQTRAVRGHAGRTILKEAESMGCDFVVISSHRPGLADYFLGSTAGYVVRHAVCPVLVLR